MAEGLHAFFEVGFFVSFPSHELYMLLHFSFHRFFPRLPSCSGIQPLAGLIFILFL